MKRSRFTEEQIIVILQEAEAGAKMPDLARKHGVPEARRLRALADAMLDNAGLKGPLTKKW